MYKEVLQALVVNLYSKTIDLTPGEVEKKLFSFFEKFMLQDSLRKYKS